jgi:glucose/arabinose dehydrogenase
MRSTHTRQSSAMLLVLLAALLGCGEDPAASGATAGTATGSSAASTGASTSSGSGGDASSFGLAFEDIVLSAGHVDATEVRFLPGGTELLLLERSGVVSHYALEGDVATWLGSFTLTVGTETDCGLISLAFDPDFADNKFLYVGHCVDRYTSGITRLTFDPQDLASVPTTAAEIIMETEPLAGNAWHNVGAIGFEPGGVMWALFGEKTIKDNAQSYTSNLGKLLRIVPNREASGSGHTAAPDNPFVGDATKSPDLYALGLRSPWRGARDGAGRYWVGDVGANDYEEINLVLAPGTNLGWPTAEGQCMDSCSGLTDPVTSWSRSSSEPYAQEDPATSPSGRRSAWVAGPYQGADTDRYAGNLDGVMLFGDFFTGWVRGMRVDDSGVVVSDRYLANLPAAASWDVGADGFLYVVTYGSYKNAEAVDPAGHLWRVIPAR